MTRPALPGSALTGPALTGLLALSLAFGASAALAETTAPAPTPAPAAAPTPAPAAAPAATPAATPAPVPENDLLNATLWMQRSVEHKAVVRGLFELARIRLNEGLRHKSWTALPALEGKGYENKPVALITDLDETVLDNSNYEASLVTRHTGFNPKEWTKYVNSESTKAMPGAVGFLKYAAKRGVKIFYVTNRTKEEEPATRANLEKLGFPMGGNVDTILTKGEYGPGSGKTPRFERIAKDYRVVLMMGDNFGDFTSAYKGNEAERFEAYKKDMKHWGRTWIVFPNPEYGSWESAAFDNDWKKSPDERRKEKIAALRAWTPPAN